jgi:hypothetical protein
MTGLLDSKIKVSVSLTNVNGKGAEKAVDGAST